MKERSFNFEFDPEGVYKRTSSVRIDEVRRKGYDKVMTPSTPERKAALAVQSRRITREMIASDQF